MQTFLPYADFAATARVLDQKRLCNQSTEVFRLLNAIRNGGGWSNHPAANMWRGYEQSLIDYGVAICDEIVSRGYVDVWRKDIRNFRYQFKLSGPPHWLGDEAFHRSHRSNLTRKKPEHYSQFWNEPPDLEYVWPRGGA